MSIHTQYFIVDDPHTFRRFSNKLSRYKANLSLLIQAIYLKAGDLKPGNITLQPLESHYGFKMKKTLRVGLTAF